MCTAPDQFGRARCETYTDLNNGFMMVDDYTSYPFDDTVEYVRDVIVPANFARGMKFEGLEEGVCPF